ncbi:alpha/beta fold hydrolase [Candidatus Dependentiae bacterium]|nr:alpha/beta fold hydrolase [Candidatus Dependentiae bacterium]
MTNWHVPARWEPQSHIILALSSEQFFDPIRFYSEPKTIEDVQIEMIKSLLPFVKIRVLANDEQQANWFKTLLKQQNIPPEKVEIVLVKHDNIWIRDTGPIWLCSNGDFKIIQSGFTEWGCGKKTNNVPSDLGKLLNIPVEKTSYVGEGGGKSFNGKGSVILCEEVERERNPNLTLKEIEDILKKIYNFKHIIWVKKGLASDVLTLTSLLPGNVYAMAAGGHVDEFCRFVGSRKILLVQVTEEQAQKSPIAKISYDNMEENYKLLQKQTDENGHPLEIIRFPLPDDLIYEIDERDPKFKQIRYYHTKMQSPLIIQEPAKYILPASYCNYLISNNVILLPRYYKPGRSNSFKKTDQEAFDTLQKCFPKHKIIQINPEPINAGGGGMNCISNEQPACKLYENKIEKHIKSGDIQICTQTFGDQKNPSVLLIAGAMAPALFWTDEFCKKISDAGYFVIRYDHRDMGLSSSIDYEKNPYTLTDLEKDAIAILDIYKIKKAHFVGHSMGGMIVQLLALNYSNRCQSITSISDGLLSNVSLSKKEKEILEKTWKVLLENKPTMNFEESISGFLKSYRYLNGTLAFDEKMATEYIKDMYQRSKHMYKTEEGQIKSFQIPHNHVKAQENIKITKEDLQKIKIPTLIIHGQEDYIMLPVNAQQTAQTIPSSTLKIIPGMGHMIFNRDLENKISKLIIEFINKI